jgi:hypothetical protein
VATPPVVADRVVRTVYVRSVGDFLALVTTTTVTAGRCLALTLVKAHRT